MIETWRWFGPSDPVTLDHARQAGARGIVTALPLPAGAAWPDEAVLGHKARIEAVGLVWSVVESIWMPDSIKSGTGDVAAHLDAYKQSVRACVRAGVQVICYNFMPVVDWTRTELRWPMPRGGYALRFERARFAAYDIHILERPGAAADHGDEVAAAALGLFRQIGPAERDALERTIIAGLPGGSGGYDRAAFKATLERYRELGAAGLRANLVQFLREVVPVAEAEGARLCIHPDDPPFPLFGLPRVVSTASDLRAIVDAVDSPANGLTFCTGSLGVRADNDLPAMAAELGPHIHFAHLRNVAREPDGSFHEAEHLDGATDMVAVIAALLAEERRRRAAGHADHAIPMRPDHGHLLLDDIDKPGINPGYSAIGRLKGLAELRGVMRALEHGRVL